MTDTVKQKYIAELNGEHGLPPGDAESFVERLLKEAGEAERERCLDAFPSPPLDGTLDWRHGYLAARREYRAAIRKLETGYD